MPIGFSISGSDNNGAVAEAELYTPQETVNHGVMVWAADRYTKENVTRVAINDTFGSQMAQDGTATATLTENINNGGDNAYWTPANLSGGSFDFTSTFSASDWPVDGTQSINGTPTNNNSLARIDKGSTIDLTPYVSLRGSIYITSWPTGGTKQVLVGFQDATNTDVGVKVDIGAYVDNALFGERQDFTIPLSDMAVAGETVQSLMLDPVDIGGGQAPNFYLDVLKLQDVGTGIEFTISPEEGTTLIVTKISVQVEDTYVVTNQEGSFGKSGFLGVGSLAAGIALGVSENGAQLSGRSALVQNMRDWMAFPQLDGVFSGSDGTNTWVNFTLDFGSNGGVTLKSNLRQKLTYRIQDNMSGLEDLKVWASGYILVDS